MARTACESVFSGDTGVIFQYSIQPYQCGGNRLCPRDAGFEPSATAETPTRGVWMKTLYLVWQNPEDRRWLPVGRLSYDGSVYRFVYTRGAKQSSRFVPFGAMRDLHVTYESPELFPLFANRLM